MPPTPPDTQLDRLFGVYLNQDYTIWGDTLEAVIAAYRTDSSAAELSGLKAEIAQFRAAHGAELDRALARAYGHDFDPALWQLDAEGFLKLLNRLID